MKLKKILAIGCIAATMAASVTGCGAERNNGGAVARQEEMQPTETAVDEVQTKAGTKTVQVTAVEGNTITAEVGTLTVPEGQAPGHAPENNAPEGEPEGQAPGEMPEGNVPEGQAPGEMPEGNAPEGEPEGMPGSSFAGSGESLTFEVLDDAAITVEFLQGSSAGSFDDVVLGSVLEVTLNDDGNAVAITVKNLNSGNGFGGSGKVTNGTAATTLDADGEAVGQTYNSDGNDENALRVDGAAVSLTDVIINKTGGDSSNTEDGDFYGQNAGFLALNGAQVTIRNAVVNTDAVNGNGVFSYGESTVVTIADSTIRTSQNNSGGIQTTGGGTTNAENLDIETQGNSAAAIRSDRGGGIVNVEGGSYVTNGTGSPAVYCTADITVSGATLSAGASEGIVVEGKNSVSLTDCDVTGNMKNTYNGDLDENIHCIMIYQSMSGDADLGEAAFSANGGSITSLSGDMFYVTNTDCEIYLSEVAFTMINDVFLRVEGNTSSRGWGTAGANGGDVTLVADAQEFSGNIFVDEISGLSLAMKNGTTYTGAINPGSAGGEVAVSMDRTSLWTLTADTYITSFDGSTGNIDANGYHLYVDGKEVL